MKDGKWIDLLVVGLVALGFVLALWPWEAKCSWCPSYKCFGGNSCGSGCHCITMGGDAWGRCISVERQ